MKVVFFLHPPSALVAFVSNQKRQVVAQVSGLPDFVHWLFDELPSKHPFAVVEIESQIRLR